MCLRLFSWRQFCLTCVLLIFQVVYEVVNTTCIPTILHCTCPLGLVGYRGTHWFDLLNLWIGKRCVKTGLNTNKDKWAIFHTARNLDPGLKWKWGSGLKLSGQALNVCDDVRTLGAVVDRRLSLSCYVTSASRLYTYVQIKIRKAIFGTITVSGTISAFLYYYPADGNSIWGEGGLWFQSKRCHRNQNYLEF